MGWSRLGWLVDWSESEVEWKMDFRDCSLMTEVMAGWVNRQCKPKGEAVWYVEGGCCVVWWLIGCCHLLSFFFSADWLTCRLTSFAERD